MNSHGINEQDRQSLNTVHKALGLRYILLLSLSRCTRCCRCLAGTRTRRPGPSLTVAADPVRRETPDPVHLIPSSMMTTKVRHKSFAIFFSENGNIGSNDRSFGCQIIYIDTIHYVILFIDTSNKA